MKRLDYINWCRTYKRRNRKTWADFDGYVYVRTKGGGRVRAGKWDWDDV